MGCLGCVTSAITWVINADKAGMAAKAFGPLYEIASELE
jgi:hypothetical protein